MVPSRPPTRRSFLDPAVDARANAEDDDEEHRQQKDDDADEAEHQHRPYDADDDVHITLPKDSIATVPLLASVYGDATAETTTPVTVHGDRGLE